VAEDIDDAGCSRCPDGIPGAFDAVIADGSSESGTGEMDDLGSTAGGGEG
jgi:hypothetical protein